MMLEEDFSEEDLQHMQENEFLLEREEGLVKKHIPCTESEAAMWDEEE